jgi:hypothetical protein
MAPFNDEARREIMRRDRWTCQSCGKSSFESEKWLIEASHDDHTRDEKYNNPDNGKAKDRICHFLDHIDAGDYKGAQLIANRIWRTGLRHYSVYENNPSLLYDDRVQFAEMMSAMQLQGKIEISAEPIDANKLRYNWRS